VYEHETRAFDAADHGDLTFKYRVFKYSMTSGPGDSTFTYSDTGNHQKKVSEGIFRKQFTG
jgi:hypothetical protein